jgi:hypothetical protein
LGTGEIEIYDNNRMPSNKTLKRGAAENAVLLNFVVNARFQIVILALKDILGARFLGGSVNPPHRIILKNR